jgi:hypothetical protein
MKFFSLIIFTALLPLFSATKSTTGTLDFDINSDNTFEMRLNSTGLGIGTQPSSSLHLQGNAIITKQIFIGGDSGSSNLNLHGTIGYGYDTISTDASLGNHSIVFTETSSSNITLTLPEASAKPGAIFHIKKISEENQLWIEASGNIDGLDSSIEMTNSSSSLPYAKLVSDGSEWYLLESSSDALVVPGADNLVGWWKFDESTGASASDSSMNGENGTLNGGQSFSGNGLNGKINRGLFFNGSSDYISAPFSSDLNPDLFSLTLWAKVTGSQGAYRTPISSRDSGLGFIIYATNANIWSLWTGSGVGYSSTNGAAVVLNQWTFVCATYDGTTLTLYIDGEDSNSSGNPYLKNTARELRIGAGNNEAGATYFFHGALDDIRVYNRALTVSEITTIYEQGL